MKKLRTAFEQSKRGVEEPFCSCETIAGYIMVDGRYCQVTVKISAQQEEWLSDDADIKSITILPNNDIGLKNRPKQCVNPFRNPVKPAGKLV